VGKKKRTRKNDDDDDLDNNKKKIEIHIVRIPISSEDSEVLLNKGNLSLAASNDVSHDEKL
jgi:hypothetical protein